MHGHKNMKRPISYTRQVQKNIAFHGFAAKAVRSSFQYLEGTKGTSIVDDIAPQEKGILSSTKATPAPSTVRLSSVFSSN